MKNKELRFKIVDVLLLALIILPLVAGLVIKVLFSAPAEGISITGAQIYFTIPMPIQNFPVTEAQVNSLLVVFCILGICLYMTHGVRAGVPTRRQALAEWAVETLESMVHENMGPFFSGFAPFIAGILALSALSSLLSLLGLFAPTSDVNIVAGWAILVFILITYYKLKGGLLNYMKSFTEPIFVLLPLNILSEVATPISMAFRHYGNVLSGSVIAVLISTALAGLSNLVLGWLPGVLGEFPLLRIGLPGILSLYFDVFSSCMQAYIFAMLTMLNISGGFPQDLYEERKRRKAEKRAAREKNAISNS
ncbi:MAG: F0F1 ATP synthase subunit A [Clostridia bacterium]|nr:F0F1 ATP synthase subunit A [Clostridia bacterium]